ncbi:MAG: hypothetical protein ACYDA1_00270 [Vulcanimicrobiaceae bacterium]
MTAQPHEDRLTSLDANVAGLRVEMRGGFARIDERFARIDERFVHVDERFDRMDEKFDRKLELLDAKIDARHDSLRTEMNDGFVRTDKKIDTLQFEMHATFRTMIGWMAGQTAIIVGSIIAVAFVLHH